MGKMQKVAPKRLPARIWSKTAVSAHFHTNNLLAGPGAAKIVKSVSKRLPARIWPKTAVSTYSHTSNLIAVAELRKSHNYAPKG
jgi:hypothetical protein